jgi:hypothetical protein
MIFLAVLVLLIGCGNKNEELADYRPQLIERREATTAWLVRNGQSMTPEADIGGSAHDAALFDGLLCYAGIEESYEAIKASQDADGRFWRAPRWVGHIEESTFSRDMALGVLACILARRDTHMALRWQTYIESIGNRLCPPNQGHCSISPILWSVFYFVWKAIGLPPSGVMRGYHTAETTMAAIAATQKGFRLHLTAVEAMILESAGEEKTTTTHVIYDKRSDNPFYAWLDGRWHRSAELTLFHCPLFKPQVRRDWIWQRDIMDGQRSSGWDCLFMTTLLLR